MPLINCQRGHDRTDPANLVPGSRARCRLCRNENQSAWNRTHPEVGRQASKTYRDDPENYARRRAETAAWHKRHPLARVIAHGRERARKAGAVVSFIALADIEALVYGKWSGLCSICRVEAFSVLDHIVPLNEGGSHALANLQPLCEGCGKLKDRYDRRRMTVRKRG